MPVMVPIIVGFVSALITAIYSIKYLLNEEFVEYVATMSILFLSLLLLMWPVWAIVLSDSQEVTTKMKVYTVKDKDLIKQNFVIIKASRHEVKELLGEDTYDSKKYDLYRIKQSERWSLGLDIDIFCPLYIKKEKPDEGKKVAGLVSEKVL